MAQASPAAWKIPRSSTWRDTALLATRISLLGSLLIAFSPPAKADVYDALYAHIQAAPQVVRIPTRKGNSAGTEGGMPIQATSAPTATLEADHRHGLQAETSPAQSMLAPLGAEPHRPFVELIVLAARRHQVSAALIHAVISVESGFNPNARSHVGAVGLMQLMPSTAAALGVRNRRNPLQNILGGTLYLRKLLDRFDGNLRHALSAYNAGPAVVIRHGGVPPHRGIKRYVRRVLERYHHLRNQYSQATR